MRKNEKQTTNPLKFSHHFKSTLVEIPQQLFKA